MIDQDRSRNSKLHYHLQYWNKSELDSNEFTNIKVIISREPNRKFELHHHLLWLWLKKSKHDSNGFKWIHQYQSHKIKQQVARKVQLHNKYKLIQKHKKCYNFSYLSHLKTFGLVKAPKASLIVLIFKAPNWL